MEYGEYEKESIEKMVKGSENGRSIKWLVKNE